jgi:hypothetical protein
MNSLEGYCKAKEKVSGFAIPKHTHFAPQHPLSKEARGVKRELIYLDL